MPILVYLTAESFAWGFCEKPYPDSEREEIRLAAIFSNDYRQSSNDVFSPQEFIIADAGAYHIRPDSAIIDRPLSTVGVSTAPASPEVHALRQPASGRCDKQPPACDTTETIPCRSRHVKTVICLNEMSTSFFKARGWGTPLHVRKCQIYPWILRHRSSVRETCHMRNIFTAAQTKEEAESSIVIHRSIKHRRDELLGILSYGCPVITIALHI
jgi:hypothetical protein